MSRVVNLSLDEKAVRARCTTEKVGISALEALPGGGVRLVCMGKDDAERIRKKLKAHLITDSIVRERHRPTTPLW